MKPTTIPDALVYGQKTTLGAPDDVPADEVEAIEAVVDQVQEGGMDGAIRIGVRIELEDGDLDRLKDRPYFWLFTLGGVHPFQMILEDKLVGDVEGLCDCPLGHGKPSDPETAAKCPVHGLHVQAQGLIVPGQ